MNDCIFCRIIKGEIPSKKVYEDDLVFAFHDITPKAPTHVLIIPKKHVAKLSEMTEKDKVLMGEVVFRASRIANELGLSDYRLVNNNGEGAGQSVFHVHFHLLGGRRLTWPPG